MQVGDEVIRFGRLILQVDVLPDGAEIVAPMKRAGRLNAAENAHKSSICLSKRAGSSATLAARSLFEAFPRLRLQRRRPAKRSPPARRRERSSRPLDCRS